MELSMNQFWATLMWAVSTFYPEQVDPSLKPRDVPQQELLPEYDFVVVGAGTAGCVVASRLSENTSWNVLLVEAGGDEDFRSTTPHLATYNLKTEKDFNYTTVEQKYAARSNGGIIDYPRGRLMGGGSAVNGMLYVRGNKVDFDRWASLGNPGWSYKDVLHYFKKTENMKERSLRASPYHGTNGPLSVQYPRYVTPLREEYIRAAEEIGLRRGDYNAEHNDNIMDYVQFTIDGPSRGSTSQQYLNPNRNRKNLHVIKYSTAEKIIIEGKEAKGIVYFRNGKHFRAMAKKEVILSAGAIDSPKLLILSGVGPKEELEQLGIELVKDLPVGRRMKDHPFVGVPFEVSNVEVLTPNIWRTNESIMAYARDKRGPLTAFGSEAVTYLNTDDKKSPSNIQLIIDSFPVFMSNTGNKNIIVCVLSVNLPNSVGTVKLKSKDFREPPLIDPNFFEDANDVEAIRKGVDIVFELMESKTMKKYSPKLFNDHRPECKDKPRKEYADCIIKYYSETYMHASGTARMGPEGDSDSVLLSDLTVKGMRKLRVVDASVMPEITSGNTNAPTIMIAEKASDLIKQKYL